MDLKDQIKQLGARVVSTKDQVSTEEATKNAFIMPFIQMMGYDVFNPLEVVPEFISDIGIKKGEKIDYAIMKDSTPIMLIECKHWNANLNVHEGQLLRYFNVSKARFGVLTNGVIYKFYTDLVEPNKMDDKPFFEVNITDITEHQIEELKKFHKSYFDIDNILNTASELKYVKEIKQWLSNELKNPSEELVRMIIKLVYPGSAQRKIVDQFTELTKRSFSQYINEAINDRLKNALNNESSNEDTVAVIAETISIEEDDDSKIVTTEEELQGFYIIKSILIPEVTGTRIVYRDAQSYFAILLDDNNRKTLCRLYLNGSKKYLAIIGDDKKEVKIPIESIENIYQHKEQLIERLKLEYLTLPAHKVGKLNFLNFNYYGNQTL